MVQQSSTPGTDADGVLVISVWTSGAGGRMLARLTMSGTSGDPSVRAVASPAELHSALDDWLASLGG